MQLLEQAPEFKEVGAGIQLGPNVFRMFEVLGLTDAVSRFAVFPESLIMLDAISGEEVTRVPLDEGFRAKFKHPYALIYRPDLLVGAARRLPQESISFASTPRRRSSRVDESGERVTVRTEDGRSLCGHGADRRRRVVVDHPPVHRRRRQAAGRRPHHLSRRAADDARCPSICGAGR